MAIGGGSKGKDRAQWKGWGLEEARDPPPNPMNPGGELKFVDLHPL